MSQNKRYYWLKLKEDFFEDDTISWLEEQENGKDYIIFYLKLFLKSLNDEGQLIRYVGERLIPYDIKALAKLTNTSPDTVAVAMKTFLDIGLIEHLETGEIYMTQINEMIGSETDAARRKRKQRAKEAKLESVNQEKLEGCDNVTVMSQKGHTDIDIDIEIDKEKEKELQQDHDQERKQVVVVESEIKKVNSFFQRNYSDLNPHIEKELSKWTNDMGSELVIEALKLSLEAEKNFNYAKGIMRNWKQSDIKTLDDIEKLYVDFKIKKSKKNNKEFHSKNEVLPEWAQDNYQPPSEEVSVQKEEISERLLRLKELRIERGVIE